MDGHGTDERDTRGAARQGGEGSRHHPPDQRNIARSRHYGHQQPAHVQRQVLTVYSNRREAKTYPFPLPVKSTSRKEMFYLTTHLTHFSYGFMASDIWLRTILIVRKETHCRHIGYSFRLTARVLLYASSHRQDNTSNGLCYTSRGALAGTRNRSMGSPHEGSIRYIRKSHV